MNLKEVIREELVALAIWQRAQLPKDVREGIQISIDKLTSALIEEENR